MFNEADCLLPRGGEPVREENARGEAKDVVAEGADGRVVEVVEPKDDFVGVIEVSAHVLEVHVANNPAIPRWTRGEVGTFREDLVEEGCAPPKEGVRRWSESLSLALEERRYAKGCLPVDSHLACGQGEGVEVVHASEYMAFREPRWKSTFPSIEGRNEKRRA